MILNHLYIEKHIFPYLKKAYLWILLLFIGLLSCVILILINHELFSYLIGLILLTFLSLLFIIPIYIIYETHISYFMRLSHFIKSYEPLDQTFNKVKVLAYEKEITFNKLPFIPISCLIDHKERVYYLPYEIFIVDKISETMYVITSDRFIMGVNHV